MMEHPMVSRSELSQIPFIDVTNIGMRVLRNLIFYDAGEWQLWMPTPLGLKRLKAQPSESDYFSRTIEKPTDIHLSFLNFMVQRASWPDAQLFIDGIGSDVHNLGASLGKLSLFHLLSAGTKVEFRRFVLTEIEYIFGVCRSLFDLLQEVIARIWDKVELRDKNIKKRKLPKSFREMVISSNIQMTEDAIETKYRVPPQLASFYVRHSEFFQTLREYRDKMIHSGFDFKSIFVTERGFAVFANTEPFASFNVWNDVHMLPNRLASLRPVVAHIITKTILACEDFAHTIQSVIEFPPEIVPGFKLFLRGYHNHELLALRDALSNCSWWEPEHPIATIAEVPQQNC